MHKGKLKIGYFADGPWSHKAFDKIVVNPNFDIRFIVPRIGSKDTTLEEYAKHYKIPYIKDVKINTDSFIEIARSFDCDLFVSMSFNQIFKERLINLPPLKTINCHAGKLPYYRGRNVINWAIINNESEIGITVHYVDEGIDTGDIIKQRLFPITIDDTYKTVLEIAYEECSNILYDVLLDFQAGEIATIKQSEIHPVGFYCGARGIGDEIINWSESSLEIYNFIRAICLPGPMATTKRGNDVVKINTAKLVKESPVYKGIPGQVVGREKQNYIVKTKDTVLEIESNIPLKIGDRLG